MDHNSHSRRRILRIWGWGYADEALSGQEQQLIQSMARAFPGLGPAVSEPRLEDFSLRRPAFTLPEAIADDFSSLPYDRLSHAYGKSYADGIRMLMHEVPAPPDFVAFPKSTQAVLDILDWASTANVAVVPFGGGTSVCGGVETDVGQDYAGCISLDMQFMNRVLEVDETGLTACMQAGIFGPELEGHLRPAGLTLRHFPQSFEFSTLGGWIATRSGGHFAMGQTHIDDFVQALDVVTPRGTLATRRLPGSGAGPSPDRMLIGSEGTLGVITEAWVRLRRRPVYRASASVRFASMDAAVSAVRAVAQSGLQPSNCRLLDEDEVKLNHVSDGRSATLIVGFESASFAVDHSLQLALELLSDHGGQLSPQSHAGSGGQDQAGAQWRQAFLRMPYYRNELMRMGLIIDTFESAVPWGRFDAFYRGIRQRIGEAIREVTGNSGHLSCRFTHVYPDGPAPYFTFAAAGAAQDMPGVLAQWQDIKRAANAAVVDLGGTITHHHAVGRDHRSGYHQQSPPLFQSALAATKHALDPAGILNPGVLLDPVGHHVGIRGAMAPAAAG